MNLADWEGIDLMAAHLRGPGRMPDSLMTMRSL
jgi:hypothetical protein